VEGKKSSAPFLHFARHAWVAQKPFKLIATNALTIQTMLGTDATERWKGVAITLFVTKVRSPKNGMVDAIRVRPTLPPQSNQKVAEQIDAAQKQIAENAKEGAFQDFLDHAPAGMTEAEAREIYATENRRG
jgi:hypothetical protein